MPPINVVFFLCRESLINTHLGNDPELIVNTHQCNWNQYFSNYDILVWHTLSTTSPPQQKVCARSHVQNWNGQPEISRCATVSTVNKWFAVTSRTLLMGNFFWNLVYHAKLSTFIGWQDTQASTRLCCDPQFSWTCQQQRDVYNGKSLVTSPHLSGLHARQLQIVVVDVNNEFLMRSIGLVIWSFRHKSVTLKNFCGPVLLLFHIHQYFTTKFKSDFSLAHALNRESLVLTTYT